VTMCYRAAYTMTHESAPCWTESLRHRFTVYSLQTRRHAYVHPRSTLTHPPSPRRRINSSNQTLDVVVVITASRRRTLQSKPLTSHSAPLCSRYTRCFIKSTPFCFFIIHSNDEQFTRNFYQLPKTILIQNFLTKYVS